MVEDGRPISQRRWSLECLGILVLLTGSLLVVFLASESWPTYIVALGAVTILLLSGPPIVLLLLLYSPYPFHGIVPFIFFCYLQWAAIWLWGRHQIRLGGPIPHWRLAAVFVGIGVLGSLVALARSCV